MLLYMESDLHKEQQTSEIDVETQYLLSSKKNRERLLESIEQMKKEILNFISMMKII